VVTRFNPLGFEQRPNAPQHGGEPRRLRASRRRLRADCWSTWADLWTPDNNAQPQYDVAWRAFQAKQTTEFIAWQADIVREYARPEQFVTTCISYTRPAVEDDELTDALDIASGNPYYKMQDSLTLPDEREVKQEWKTDGVWSLYQTADWMFSSKQSPFLVTETNAQSIGAPWENRPAFDGQWRQAAWALVSRGARMIEYWHWHTLHFGTETYWGGVLPHSGKPGRAYAELARLGAEFDKAGNLVAGLEPDARCESCTHVRLLRWRRRRLRCVIR